MSLSREFLLWCSRNEWMKNTIPKYKFVQKALKRFMPGEQLSDAMNAAYFFQRKKMPVVFTRLGENLTQMSQAEENIFHYKAALETSELSYINAELSIKLTQFGLDISKEQAIQHCEDLISAAKKFGKMVWLDMEDSSYVDETLRIFRMLKEKYDNVGICLQAYLFRTKEDIENLQDLNPAIRLVKGAYRESADTAFPKKSDVDQNFLQLSRILLENQKMHEHRAAFATHDEDIIRKITRMADELGIAPTKVEFNMLYGIQQQLQLELNEEGYKVQVLISYGDAWYPWYLRRLAERPANVWFVLKNIK